MNNAVVLATNNSGKVKEFQEYFSRGDRPVALTIISQSFYNIASVEETGLTFIENAILKARHAAQITGLPALADDSGLVIDALNGEPGIYSARYAGAENDFTANIQKVLDKMQGIEKSKRTARFYCVLAYFNHPNDQTPIIAEGVWEGEILTESSGEKGFGYDPIFFVPTYNCSAAELSTTEKNKLSHRAQALQQLILQFKD